MSRNSSVSKDKGEPVHCFFRVQSGQRKPVILLEIFNTGYPWVFTLPAGCRYGLRNEFNQW